MAETQTIAKIEIDVDQATTRLAELSAAMDAVKARNKELRQGIKDETVDFAAATREIAENNKVLKLLGAEQKAVTGEIQATTTALAAEGDSFVEMKARVSQLETEYKSLTKAERESASGQELKKKIIDQKNELRHFNEELGNWQDNVGHYEKALGPLGGILDGLGLSANKLASGGMTALRGGLQSVTAGVKTFAKTLLTTPLGWIAAAVGALVAVFGKLKDAIAKNDEASTGMARLYAVTVQPVLNVVTKVFGKLAEWIGKAANALADFLGQSSEAAKKADALVVATDKLEDMERTYAKNSADRSARIEELREKAADAESYSIAERKKALQDAMEFEQQEHDEAKKLANERLRIEQERNKMAADTSDAAKDRENALAKAVDDADRAYAKSKRTLTRQLKSLTNEEVAASKERAKAREDEAKAKQDAMDEELEKEKQHAEAVAKLRDEAQRTIEDTAVKNIKNRYDREQAEATLAYTRDLQALEEKYGKEAELSAEYQQLRKDREAQYLQELAGIQSNFWQEEEANDPALNDDRVKALDERIAEIQEMAESEAAAQVGATEELNEKLVELNRQRDEQIAAIHDEYRKAEAKKALEQAQQLMSAEGALFDSIGQMADAFAKDEKSRAKAQKVMAVGKAAVESGIAIASGTAQAMSMPFPANIAAIVSTTAAVLANIATAVSTIKGAKFATGGIVPGTSYTGDHVMAGLNSGEMVLNKAQQARLFDLANGATTTASATMVAALTEAVAAMPAPVLQYREFEQFTGEVKSVRMAAEY